MQKADRARFAVDDNRAGSSEEYKAAARSYFAYLSRFFVNEEASQIWHEMALSLFPNWTGHSQTRVAALDGDRLHLATDGP